MTGNICRIVFLLVAVAIFPRTAHALPFTFDARSLGMGSVSTATADLATSAWANPAMLTNQPEENKWSLLIGVGAFLRDDDDLIGDIEDFQDADDVRRESDDLLEQAQAILEMRRIVRDIEDKAIAPEATALVAFGIAFESFAMALSVRADAIAGGIVTNLSCPLIEPGCDPNELLSEDFNILNVDGVLTTEFGVSFAKDFTFWDRKVSLGIKPKLVEIDVFSDSESILTLSTDYDYAEEQDNRRNQGTFETIDLGLAADLSESFRLGLSLRNLITDEFGIFDQTLSFDTEVRMGLAYHNNFMVLAVDYDLTENEPLLPNESFGGLRTQYLAIGAEFNGLRHIKFRLGARRNVASDISDGADDPLYTAGFGFWVAGINLDASIIKNDNTTGIFLQGGAKF